MSNKHFKLGASSCKRWSICAGSLWLIARTPRYLLDLTSEFAEEGTEAHEVAEKGLNSGKDAKEITNDENIYDAVQVYLDEVRSYLHDDTELLVEKRFSLSEDMGGTNDALVLDHFSNEIIVFDYKHGVGEFVDVEENYQLMYYALGVLNTLDKNFISKDTEVTLCIVQPRYIGAEPVRKWKTTVGYLLNDFKPKLLKWAEKARNSKELKSGDHCRFCPAIAVCPAYKNLVIKGQMNPALAENLKIAKMLSEWKKSIEKVAYQSMIRGTKVPGFKLVEGRGKREFKDIDSVIEELKDNKDAFYPLKLKSPAQLEKIMGRDFVAERQVRIPGKLTIATEDDRRPESSSAALDFKDVEIEYGDGHI